MSKIKESEDLTRHQILLFAGDFDELKDLHPDVGASAVIRRIVRKYLADTRKQAGIETPNIGVQL